MPIFGRGCLARKTMKIAPRTPREKQNQRMTCPSFCSLAIPNSVDAENQLEAIRFMTSGNTARFISQDQIRHRTKASTSKANIRSTLRRKPNVKGSGNKNCKKSVQKQRDDSTRNARKKIWLRDDVSFVAWCAHCFHGQFQD